MTSTYKIRSVQGPYLVTGLTARMGYVIHSVIIFTHSFVNSVEMALVASTVKPPG